MQTFPQINENSRQSSDRLCTSATTSADTATAFSNNIYDSQQLNCLQSSNSIGKK